VSSRQRAGPRRAPGRPSADGAGGGQRFSMSGR
jgi:hypothetical protein